jgi:hypothetical protein
MRSSAPKRVLPRLGESRVKKTDRLRALTLGARGFCFGLLDQLLD